MKNNKSGDSVYAWTLTPMIPVAWGEVFDKITILEIKAEKISNADKRFNVLSELNELLKVIGDIGQFPDTLPDLVAKLKVINLELWDVEDSKRDCERRQCFDQQFIELARKVYINNDKRAAIKKTINSLLGSRIVEEKGYQSY
jgi:hypothetical protein